MCSCVRFSCHVRLDDVKQFNHGRCWAVAACFSWLALRVRRWGRIVSPNGNKCAFCFQRTWRFILVRTSSQREKKETKKKSFAHANHQIIVRLLKFRHWLVGGTRQLSRCRALGLAATQLKKQTHLLLSDYSDTDRKSQLNFLFCEFVSLLATHGISRYFLPFSLSPCVAAKHMISYATRKPNIARFFHMHSHTFGASSVSGCNFSFRRCSQQKSTSPKWFQKEKKRKRNWYMRKCWWIRQCVYVCARVHEIPEMERITLRWPRARQRLAFANLCRKGTTTKLRNRYTFGITCLDVTEIMQFIVHTWTSRPLHRPHPSRSMWQLVACVTHIYHRNSVIFIVCAVCAPRELLPLSFIRNTNWFAIVTSLQSGIMQNFVY